MAGELGSIGPGSGRTVYCLIFQTSTGKIWNGSAFETYTNANYANYPVSLVEQGGSNIYIGNMPGAIPAGTYGVVVVNQLAGSPAQTDQKIGNGNIEWNGTAPAALSDTLTSGGFSLAVTSKIPRGTQVLNFPFRLVSSTDHLSSLVSGIVSGQIFRDGGSFGGLQSGLSSAGYKEIGNGWYTCTLTSGDLLANTVGIQFLGVGVSGGTSDTRDIGLILQRTSGF
jgi:hypothetical protein